MSGSSQLFAPSDLIWLCEFTSEGATIDILPTPVAENTSSQTPSDAMPDLDTFFYIKNNEFALHKINSRKQVHMIKRNRYCNDSAVTKNTRLGLTKWVFVSCPHVTNAYTIWQVGKEGEKLNFLVCWKSGSNVVDTVVEAAGTSAVPSPAPASPKKEQNQQKAQANTNIVCLTNVKHQQELSNAMWSVTPSKHVSGGVVIQSLVSNEYMICGASVEKAIVLVPDEHMFAWTLEEAE